MASADFAPGFSFDFQEPDVAAAPQAPWEFGGTLAQAHRDCTRVGTSIDVKIQQRLQAREAKKADKAAARKRSRAAANGVADSDDEEDDEEEGGSDDDDDELDDASDDEDAPLPGELDDDDDDDEEQDEEEDEESDGAVASSDAEKEEEEEEEEEIGLASSDDGGGGGEEEHEEDNGEGWQDARRRASAAAAATASAAKPPPAKRQRGAAAAAAAASAAKPAKPDPQQHQRQQRQQQANGGANGGNTQNGFYAAAPEGTSFRASSFADLHLSRPLLRAVEALGYSAPTPIQAACIPLALAGRDVCGSAVTGSGKTAAFALPSLERLLYRPRQHAATYVLVLAPTRELAAQIHGMVVKLAQFTDIRAALVVGGLSLSAQAAELRRGPEVVVGTPGRVIDHVRNSAAFGLEDLAVLVLDEADRLLEMGFRDEVAELVRLAPRRRQTLLFSATFSDEVQRLAALSLRSPVRLAADAAAAAPASLRQQVVRLKGAAAGASKEAALLSLCARSFASGRCIVFCKTKQRAHRLKLLFGLCKLPPASELHGDMSQAARLEALEAFRTGAAAFLLATDVAARGLDILGVQVVINYDAPTTLESYLHRIGRTARAGAAGLAVTLAEDGDRNLLRDVVRRAKATLEQRALPPNAVASWRARTEAAEPDVARILSQEREEAAERRAAMEADRVANMIEHEDEIAARPRRTWFQTSREKAAAVAAAAPGAAEAAAAEAAARASRDKKAKKRAEMKERRAKAASERDGGELGGGARTGGKRGGELASETAPHSAAIRGIKSRVRELVAQGVPASKAGKIAAAAVSGAASGGSGAAKKKKRAKTGDGGGGSGLFSGDGIGKPGGGSPASLGGDDAAGAGGGGVRSSGARSAGKGAARVGGDRGRSMMTKSQLNRVKRGGKGKGAFKSKKRHKRR